MKKAENRAPLFIFNFLKELLLRGSSYGTSICTAAAANALVSVDNVLAVTLGDAAGGASISASAASDALIRNLVCHVYYLQINLSILYFNISSEKIKRLERKSL